MKQLVTLGTIVAVMSLLLISPAIAQDRSADTSFEFAGKAEYNRSAGSSKDSSSKSGSSKDGSSKSSSPKTLPETGGVPLLALGVGVLVIGGGLLVRHSN